MRELVTTIFEVLGLALIVAGGALWTGHRFGSAAGCVAGGVGLVAASLLLVALAPKPSASERL